MSFATVRQFLDHLRRERILPDAALDQAERLAQQFGEPRLLALQLTQQGLLTSFQADLLLKGNSAHLILKDYVLLEPLGEGAMGKVFKARHRVMKRLVAIKTIRPEALDSAQAVKRFEREIEVATRVDHPNIVRALDAGKAGQGHYFVMEFVDGIDLARLVEDEGVLPIPLACDFARQVALGLQHIHERGGVHRDIKPQNLVAAFSRNKGDLKDPASYDGVKILDLGLAILRPQETDGKTILRLTRVGAVMGTPDFMAPEQTTDAHTVDIRADLYSLGCTLYYLLTGQPLFYAGSVAQKLFQHRSAPVPDVRQHRPEVPEGLAQILKKLLGKTREERYATPGQTALALSPFCTSTPVSRSQAAAPPKAPPRRAAATQAQPLPAGSRRWAWVLAGGIMFGVGLTALLVFLFSRGNPEPESNTPSGGKDKIAGITKPADKVEHPKKVEEPSKKVAEEPKKEPAKPKEEPPLKTFTNSINMKLVWIPSGRFQMGSPPGENGRGEDELQHEVDITQGFSMGVHEVTQEEYLQVMGSNPSYFNALKVGKNTDAFPVETVSRNDAMEFCRKLTEKEKGSGRVYDLPTEAEWEYACRAGSTTVFAFGDALGSDQANFRGDSPYGGAAKGPSLKRTTSVGSYKPNAWGLYDMHGNVWEWCKDWYDPDYYRGSPVKDPQGPDKGSSRVLRGGSWGYTASDSRSAHRDDNTPGDRNSSYGFRVVARLPNKEKPARPMDEPSLKTLTNSINMKLVWIEPGRFVMGSPPREKDRSPSEVQHKVEITQGFYMDVFEVTQEEYRQVMGSNPSYFNATKVGENSDAFPVDQVSWDEAMEFCRKLTEKEKAAGLIYDLPTEAEWEYACRAGTTSVFAFGDALDSNQANFLGNIPYGGASKGPDLKRSTTVGSYKPNAWGLHDMHGNVWEWCKDWFGNEYYRESGVKDPAGPATGSGRVLRGGAWLDAAWYCRSARRSGYPANYRSSIVGFRVVARLSPKSKEVVAEPKGEPLPKTLTNSINMKLVWIEPGRFVMGSPPGEKDRSTTEVQHKVEITQGFYMGVYEVTQGEFRQVMGSNPSFFNAANVGKNTDAFPVEMVTWEMAMAFCGKLTELEKDTGRVYDLPTEAEWEYACRAGSTSVFAFGDTLGSDQSNFKGDFPYGGAAKGPFLNRPTSVGSYKANAWGLYDMHGNVWEWCKDWYGPDYYRGSPLKNPAGPATGSNRALRGGSWGNTAGDCRSAMRGNYKPTHPETGLGIRVVVRLSPLPTKPVEEGPKKEPGKPREEPSLKTLTNSINMKLVWIDPGRFQMGSPPGEKDRSTTEVQHKVEITQGFSMGVYEVTQEEYRQVMGSNPSYFNAARVGKNTDAFPVDNVNWNDALEFCQKLTEKEKSSGRVYDLPTEAEWEFACRAGSLTVFAFGDALGSDQANLNGGRPYGGAAKGPYLGRTTTVGSYKPNRWGLNDMHGNVMEWCKDWYGKDYFRESPGKDPTGPAIGDVRVLRGGSWDGSGGYCRAAQRIHFSPGLRSLNIGFRVVVRSSPRAP